MIGESSWSAAGTGARAAMALTRLATAGNPEVKSMRLTRWPSGLKWVIGIRDVSSHSVSEEEAHRMRFLNDYMFRSRGGCRTRIAISLCMARNRQTVYT
jgi:hypothetical protein